MVRTFESGETMVLVQVHPGSLTPEKLQEEKIALKTLFESLTKVRVDSLLFQVSDAMFNGFKEETESELILGSTHIHETLLGLQFRVSTTAFFQVNTKAAEVLYATIKERIVEANSGNALENVVLLDLCCGTGTIGLTLAGSVKKVIGIEMVKEAIQDAEYNAAKNGMSPLSLFQKRNLTLEKKASQTSSISVAKLKTASEKSFLSGSCQVTL